MRKIIATTAGISYKSKMGKTNIYPNPAKDYIEIIHSPSSPSFQNSTVEIYTVLGEKVMSVLAKENLKIDISGLADGVYFIKVGEVVGRFIKH